MPARPNLRSTSILPTSCTCRPTTSTSTTTSNTTATRKTLSTLTTDSTGVGAGLIGGELFLDFLYPTFGFFSRALPPISLSSSTSSSSSSTSFLFSTPSSSTRTRFRSNIGIVGNNNHWKRSNSILLEKCFCGRTQLSCLRCRAASTSTRIGSSISIEEPILEDLRTISTTPLPLPLPVPPPPPLNQLNQLYRRLDMMLPSTRGILGSSYYWRLDRIQEARQDVLKMLALFDQNGKGISSTLQLDVIRLFARLAIVLPSSRSTTTTEESELVEEFRKTLGNHMKDYLNRYSVSKGDQHKRSLALLRIDSIVLSGNVPTMISPTKIGEEEDQFFLDLAYIFKPSPEEDQDLSSVSQRKSYFQAQLSAFSILLDHWTRMKNHQGSIEALKFVAFWQIDSIFTEGEEGSLRSKKYGLQLKSNYVSLINRIQPTPLKWYQDYLLSLPPQEVDKRMGPHLITYLSNRTFAIDALTIWDSLKGRTSPRDEFIHLDTPSLLQGLLESKCLVDAGRVATYLNELTKYITDTRKEGDENNYKEILIRSYRILAKVSAQEGRPIKTFELLSSLEEIGWETGLEGVARQMRSNSESNDLVRVRLHFNSAELRDDQVNLFDKQRIWGELIRAHIRLGDLKGAMAGLKEMVESDLLPTRALLTSLLYGQVNRGDLENTYTLFNSFGDYNLTHNVVSYSALVTLHSRRRDPESVERVISEMKSLNIVPDLLTWTTFIDSLVEVGSYPSALKIFEWLLDHEDPSFHPDTPTRNVILKAGVLAGAPALSLLKLFYDGIQRGLRPNAQSYSLLMHTLCTNGLMNAAEELFVLMDSSSTTTKDSSLAISSEIIKPDVFTFSSMMYGYLKRGNVAPGIEISRLPRKVHGDDLRKARAVLHEMSLRKIQPSKVTIGMIMGAFITQEGREGLKKAEEIARKFLAQSQIKTLPIRLPTTSNQTFAKRDHYSILTPIINAHAKNLSPDLALNLFTSILSAQFEPSIMQHTSLMDAYRRSNNLEGVRTIWRRLYNHVGDRFGRHVEERLGQEGRNVLESLPDLATLIEPHSAEAITTKEDVIEASDSTSTSTIVDALPLPSDSSPTDSSIPSSATPSPPSPPRLSSKITPISSLPAPNFKVDQYQRNVLCLPLTILINALTFNPANTAGGAGGANEDRINQKNQREILKTWQMLSRQGFQFDSSNWNSLALSLTKNVGDVEKSFEICENVLCPLEEGEDFSELIRIEFGNVDKGIGGGGAIRNPKRLKQFNRRDKKDSNSLLQASNIRSLLVSDPSEKVILASDVEEAGVEVEEGEGEGVVEEEGKRIKKRRPQVLTSVLLNSNKKKQFQYWFIHTSLVVELDKFLKLLGNNTLRGRLAEENLEEFEERIREEKELKERLIQNHPKTIRRIRMRKEELFRFERIEKERSGGII